MRESRTYGSVRGALSNGRPYRVPNRRFCDCHHIGRDPDPASCLSRLRKFSGHDTRSAYAHRSFGRFLASIRLNGLSREPAAGSVDFVRLHSCPMADDPPKRLTPAEARKKAAECRALARIALEPSHRVMLTNIAETWDRIADESTCE
jgi:hypothetical protein